MYKLFIPLGVAIAIAWPGLVVHAQQFGIRDDAVRVGEPSAPLTLAAAIALALDHNSDISAARHALAAAEAELQQAGARPNPEISALMEDTRKQTRTTTYQISQAIELGGKRGARVDAAAHARDLASLELRLRRADIRIDVTTAFFEVAAAQEQRRVSQESVALAAAAAGMAQRRVVAGKAAPLEETKARVAEAGARLEAAQAHSELDGARRRLGGIWGNPAPRFTRAETAEDVIPPALPDIANLMARLDSAPALRLARAEVGRQQALANIESSKRLPDLTLSAGAKRDEEAQRSMWVIGVSIPIPLFDSNQGNTLAALRRTDLARDKLAAAEIRLHTDVAAAYDRLKNLRLEITALQVEILPGAQSAYAAAGKGFQLGKFAFLDVLDAQRTLFQARSQYLRALSGAYRAAAELERLAGPADLNDPTE